MSKHARHLLGLLTLVVVVSVAAGATGASAASQARAVRMPVAVYRLKATLTPMGAAVGSGHFDALLVRIGPPLLEGSSSGVSPVMLCPSSPKSGVPCRLLLPQLHASDTGLHWALLWRLSLTGVTGTGSAAIRVAAAGSSPAAAVPLCTSCRIAARTGWRTARLTEDVGQALASGNGVLSVQTATGTLSGPVVVVARYGFSGLPRA